MNQQDFTGKEIAGYRLTRHVGSGGMGDVYKAVHPVLNREAAVKILFQRDLVSRFENEAYIQASVNHPHIARLYEYVQAGNHHCIIMEYVEGEALDQYLRRKGRLSSAETESILVQIVSALQYLHEQDIIHRDIKPQNFRVQQNGTVKMLDFGIAKHKYSPRLTQQGFVVGTTEYMSPEQFQENVEKKSDVWSLGVMTYEMITGYLPFEGTNPVSLRHKITGGIYTRPGILVPDLSEKLTYIIEKSLCTAPQKRITAAAIADCLQHGIAHGKLVAFNNYRIPAIVKKLRPARIPVSLNGWRIAGFVLGALLVFVILRAITGNENDPPDNDKIPSPASSALVHRVKITVPGVEDARLTFPNGQTMPLPYEVSGVQGNIIEFTLHADGYSDKKVEMEINNRRNSYEYRLEKISR